ncbi:hypothetical protein EVAR_83270_1 [Eumeta japonica]|uniref:Uncharacterized protein n=1 Tax=Eumeta variegata TaxID=151549 RepID=A0A4C1X6Z2_EUMVA|nr:hypothetical protein EVAR_83270_1 [Eumeta japonica]
MLRSIWLCTKMGWIDLRYHTFVKYRRKVTASVGAFRLVTKSSGASLSSITPLSFIDLPLSVRYPISTQKAGYSLVTPLRLSVFMDGDVHLLCWPASSFAHR